MQRHARAVEYEGGGEYGGGKPAKKVTLKGGTLPQVPKQVTLPGRPKHTTLPCLPCCWTG
jgi:hypothetical protein